MVKKLTEYERGQAIKLLRKALSDLNYVTVEGDAQGRNLMLIRSQVKSALAYLD